MMADRPGIRSSPGTPHQDHTLQHAVVPPTPTYDKQINGSWRSVMDVRIGI
jgi:hypothetical protein